MGGPTTACTRRCYPATPPKALVILARLARVGVLDTHNAWERDRWAVPRRLALKTSRQASIVKKDDFRMEKG